MQHANALSRFVVGAMILLGGPATASPITVDQALQRADSRPLVGVANASAEEGAARRRASEPRCVQSRSSCGSAGPRFVAGERSIAFDIGLGHTFELGGKRDARRAWRTRRSRWRTPRSLRRRHPGARIEAWRAFQVALVTRERVAMAKEAEQVAIQVATATTERQKVGFGTQLEINLTTAEVGRAKHDRLDAERKYDAAVADLARAIGASASESFEPDGQLVPPPALADDVNTSLRRAMKERPEARVARASTNVARAEIRAADAQAIPDLSIGVTYEYERDPDATAQTILGTVGDRPAVLQPQSRSAEGGARRRHDAPRSSSRGPRRRSSARCALPSLGTSARVKPCSVSTRK